MCWWRRVDMWFCLLVVFSLLGGGDSKHVLTKRQANDSDKIRKVVSIAEPPYLMVKEDGSFEGFIPDLMEQIASSLDVDFEVYLVEDGKYGTKEANGTWNGIIGDLLTGKADLAAAPLTITSQRERVCDFSKPFMTVGITTLVSKSKGSASSAKSHFWLLQPFAAEVWVVILAAFVVFVLLLYVLNRWLPKTTKAPAEEDPGCGRESRGLCSAVGRLVMGAASPQPVAATVLLVTWILFVLATGALYLSTLMAFTLSAGSGEADMAPPYNTLEELVASDLDYGYVSGGSTDNFFWTSKVPLFQAIAERVRGSSDSSPSLMVSSVKEGIERVRAGGYALLGESATFEYIASRECNLRMVGGLVNSVGYGLATPIGSDIRDHLSLALLELRETGRIQQLYNKWWQDRSLCANEPEDRVPTDSGLGSARTVTLGSFWSYGSVSLLIIGLALTLVIAAIEKFI